MTTPSKYDVVVVGASVGGCTAAILYARHGLNVALVEKSRDVGHYKKVCTHYLQPLALQHPPQAGPGRADRGGRRAAQRPRSMDRVGLDPRRRPRPGRPRLQHPPPDARPHPAQPGARHPRGDVPRRGLGLRPDPRRPRADRRRGDRGGRGARWSSAPPWWSPPTVRTSRVAKLAGTEAHVNDNGRFTYYTYYRGVALSSGGNAQYWHLHPNLAYAFRNDDDTTLLGIFLPKGELRAFKADPMGNFRRFWEGVPDAPLIGDAEPICELRGATEMPNHWRPASAPGIAFVGDAAMALDPIWGTGCSYAFASADWLVEHTAPAFGAGKDLLGSLDRGLALPQDPSVTDPLALHAHRRPLHGPRPQPGRAPGILGGDPRRRAGHPGIDLPRPDRRAAAPGDTLGLMPHRAGQPRRPLFRPGGSRGSLALPAAAGGFAWPTEPSCSRARA